MDKKQAGSMISYLLKTAYFLSIFSLVLFFFWKEPLFMVLFFLSCAFALSIEAVLFLLGFGLFSQTKPVLMAAVATFLLLQLLTFLSPKDSPLLFISSCSMLPALSPGDAFLVLSKPSDTPIIGIGAPYREGQAEILFENQTLMVDGSLYFFCSHQGSAFCNEFIAHPDKFIEKKGAITFHYSLCTRSDSANEPCVSSATIGNTTISALPKGEVVVFPGQYAGAPEGMRIAHRAIFAINDSNGNIFYFTKGDNNPTFDSQAYDYVQGRGGSPVPLGEIMGRVSFQVPFIGALSKNYNVSAANNACRYPYR